MNDTIAALVRAGRLRKGLKQEELADQAGISRTTLVHLERGGTPRPRASTLSRVASVLELDPEALAKEWGSRPESQPPSLPTTAPPLEWLREQRAFDRRTNPALEAAFERQPSSFHGFTDADWACLASQMGVGGGLTVEGAIAAAERIQADRETIARLQVVLQTHLREPARELIRALYQSVAITPGSPGRTGETLRPQPPAASVE
jgi:transcriptional regulator with XRE-family HTH domain